MTQVFNPLTTNDDYSHQNSAACFQLAQSVLKIGSALAEREKWWDRGRWVADSAWRLLQLAIERKGLVSTGCPVLVLSCTNGP